MKQIAVTAEFHFKPDQTDTGLNILKAIIFSSRQEKGCMQYELFQSGDNPNVFIMIEKWRSHQDWLHHQNADHILSARDGIKGLLEAEPIVKSFNFVM